MRQSAETKEDRPGVPPKDSNSGKPLEFDRPLLLENREEPAYDAREKGNGNPGIHHAPQMAAAVVKELLQTPNARLHST